MKSAVVVVVVVLLLAAVLAEAGQPTFTVCSGSDALLSNTKITSTDADWQGTTRRSLRHNMHIYTLTHLHSSLISGDNCALPSYWNTLGGGVRR